jgi:RHS repeat-associated protein
MNTHTWDSANRLVQLVNGANTYQFGYNGDSNRLSQSVNSVLTKYMLDTQVGLALVLSETTGANTTRYLHGVNGVNAVYNGSNTNYYLSDGLGSTRAMTDALANILSNTTYSPYGVPDTAITGFAFTGEQRDVTGFQYHRARYLNPNLASWISQDPFEGFHDRAMSLNGYAWVEGNTPNGLPFHTKQTKAQVYERL